ncbi:3-hydroxyacyl-CoA dehydrogenase NAD-binding domain-containing protein [Candidatus Omnitrophota bacterium]
MKTIQKVSVIGSGIMGAGIANAIFKKGFEVKLFDLDKDVVKKAVSDIKSQARRKMDPDKISMAASLEEAVKGADLIIEAIIEDLDIKCKFFKELGGIAPEETIFASNTSSLSISAMARASGRPKRFIGLHFFNPAVIMRLVEIIVPKGSSPGAYTAVKEFIDNIKKTGVKCIESPGFIVNRILIPLVNEAFYLLDEKAKASKAGPIDLANDIDSAFLKEGILLMGPYDMVDITGIDTAYKVAQVIYEGFNRSPRYIPAPLLKSYVDKGFLGRKNKRGVYYYGNQANDPDLNPCLDEKGEKIRRLEDPAFHTIELVACIVNEAFRVLEEGIVDDLNDIELCMDIGARWLKGPFALAKKTGIDVIHSELKRKYERSGKNPRYEPSGFFTKLPEKLKSYLAGA